MARVRPGGWRGLLLMEGAGEPVAVRIVTAPDVACGGPTWSGTVGMIRGRLARRFGQAVSVEHVTVFSPRFFELADVAAGVQAGMELPIVFVGGAVVSRGGKVSEPRIVEALRAAGVNGAEGTRS
jgi:hypothetical protein